MLNVKDYGATGDGVTDDRAAFAALEADGDHGYAPAGTYLIASNLTLSKAWVFKRAAILKPANGVIVTFAGGSILDFGRETFDTSAGGSFVFQAGGSGVGGVSIGGPGAVVHGRLLVPGPAQSSSPNTQGIVGMPVAAVATGVKIGYDLRSGGTVKGTSITPTLRPDFDATEGTVSGDAIALEVSPIVHFSDLATGPSGGPNTHKWVVSHWIELPELVRVGSGIGGKPQEVVGLRIGGPSTPLDETTATRGIRAIRIQGGYANEIDGGILLKNDGSNPIQPLQIGSSEHANMLRISGWMRPVVDAVKNSTGEGFSIRCSAGFNTHTSGTHAHLGNTYLLAPTITVSGGAAVTNFTTLRIGGAPIGGVKNRAIWVENGLSEFGGQIKAAKALLVQGLAAQGGSANLNDYNPGDVSTVRFAPSAPYDVTGIVAQGDGHVLYIYNISGSKTVTFKTDSASSAAANRIYGIGNLDTALGPYQGLILRYDLSATHWRVIART